MKIVFICLMAVFYSGTVNWVAPKDADAMTNPRKGHEEEAIAAGKKIFNTNCATCHGEKGKGDGVASAGLTPKPANFTHPEVVKESDGALFWKITNGKAPMPAWEKQLKPEQRWDLVCYIRSLQAKKK
ncbi:MAG: c-type cytochrome [Bacteroidia bacterium]